MLPFVSKLIWGPSQSELDEENERRRQAEIEDTTCEEKEDWLVITCDDGEKQLSGDDDASVCSEMSDSSWVIAPSPRFCTLSTPNSTSHEALENLLIEHPTMSVYAQHAAPTSEPSNGNDNAKNDDRTQTQESGENNKNARVALRYQRQLAHHLGVSQPGHKAEALPAVISPKVKLTRKGLHRHNKNYIQVTRGKKCYRIQQCAMKGGRRR